MDTRYLELEDHIYNRRRQLNLLEGIRIGATISLSISFVYLILFYLDVVQLIQPWWLLVIFNVVAIGAGALIGRTRPIALEKDIYQVDKVFRLGEKLTTISYLRQIRTAPEFLEALYRKVESLRIDVKDAITISDNSQKGWMGVGGLVLGSALVLLLWGAGLSPAASFWGTGGPNGSNSLDSSLILNDEERRDLEDLLRNGETENQSDPFGLEEREQTCFENSGSSSTTQGFRNEIFVDDSCSSQGDSPSLEDMLSNDERPEAQPNSVSQELAELLAQLLNGQIGPNEASQELQQLAQQLPPGAMQDLLEELSELSDLEDLVERLQEAFDEAVAQEDQGQNELADNNSQQGGQGANQDGGLDSEFGSDFIDRQAPRAPGQESSGNQSQSNTPEGQIGGGSESTQAGENSDSQSGDGGGEGGDESEGSEGGERQSGGGDGDAAAAEGEENNSGLSGQSGQTSQESGGDGIGEAPGNGQESGEGVEEIETDRNVYVNSDQLPEDFEILKKLVSFGLPVDLLEEKVNGKTQIRLNVEQVEAVMEAKDLPPQLRALVRTYFLAITGER